MTDFAPRHHEVIGNVEITVFKVDRRLDPYLAFVIEGSVVAASGLFATEQKARAWAKYEGWRRHYMRGDGSPPREVDSGRRRQ